MSAMKGTDSGKSHFQNEAACKTAMATAFGCRSEMPTGVNHNENKPLNEKKESFSDKMDPRKIAVCEDLATHRQDKKARSANEPDAEGTSGSVSRNSNGYSALHSKKKDAVHYYGDVCTDHRSDGGPSAAMAKCRIIDESESSIECSRKHPEKYTACSSGVVYKIPLTCGKIYIGQTGRCVNDRVHEHAKSLKNKKLPSNIVKHWLSCKCEVRFENTSIIAKHHDRLTREIAEAYSVMKNKSVCISEASVKLSAEEFATIDGLFGK